MTDIASTLGDRGKTHGDFTVHAEITQSLKSAARLNASLWYSLEDTHREAIEMILHKIGRIVAGDPNHHDHWHDIQGYSKLVADRIAENAEQI